MDRNEHAHLRSLIAAYADGVLGAEHSRLVETHLADCADCRGLLQDQRAAAALVSDAGERFQLPEGFADSLMAALPSDPKPVTELRRPQLTRWLATGWAGTAMALAASLFLLLSPPTESALQQELVGAHVRSLMANHLMDVESSDRHTVKPWFNGRVNIAPLVLELADAGFPLSGGRLDYIDGKTAVALVYRGGAHPINLFVWPVSGQGDAAMSHAVRNGYSLVEWRRGGLAYAAVSDIDAQSLERFWLAWRDKAASVQ